MNSRVSGQCLYTIDTDTEENKTNWSIFNLNNCIIKHSYSFHNMKISLPTFPQVKTIAIANHLTLCTLYIYICQNLEHKWHNSTSLTTSNIQVQRDD